MDWDVFLRNDRCGNSVWRGFYIEDKDFFNWTIDLNDSRCPIRLTIEAKRNKAIYDAAFGYNCDIRMSLRSNVIHNDFKVPISSWNELPLTLIGI